MCLESKRYLLNEKNNMNLNLKTAHSTKTNNPKQAMVVLFLVLLLDLIGFSIVFPVFPSLAKYYWEFDSDNLILQYFYKLLSLWYDAGSLQSPLHQLIGPLVLFGGALGAVFSFLQFLAAPFWGTLSDKYGRKPILLITLSATCLSYFLWFWAQSFTILFLSRVLAGIMGGNISTATAIAADVSDQKTRSKTMALVGIAFGLGFMGGPILGGILSMLDLTIYFPQWVEYGVNPFSSLALVAFLLSFASLLVVWFKFEETLPPNRREIPSVHRTSNVFLLFKPLPYQGVNITNFVNFIYLTIFSGIEFTLVFLAYEYLSYNSFQNAVMFLFSGIVMIIVQGLFVRKKVSKIGEKKMAIMGLVSLIPGFIITGIATSTFLLFLGLYFISFGSAMVMPCLTALVSLYAPSTHQGKVLGVFRSLGALARAIGPILFAIIYWKMGGKWTYWLSSILMIIPIFMIWKLPSLNFETLKMEKDALK